MKKIFLSSIFFTLLLSLISINFVSAATTTISTNTSYTNTGSLGPNSANGVLFVSEINQKLVSIKRSPLDTSPFCIVIDGTTNQIIHNSTWTSNICNTNNTQLIAGNLYRIATESDSTSYQNSYDQTYSPAYYPGIGDFIGGCYSYNCNIYTISSTMYSIESITLSIDIPASPPILTQIGPKNKSENMTLKIQLEATDSNVNDTLTFLTNAQTILPSQSFLNSTSGLFTWKPTFNDQGVYYVNFYVTDGQFIDYETVRIQVIDVSFATITIEGNANIGNSITLRLNDSQSANKPYVLSASLGRFPGIPLSDGRIIPLNDDWLFNAVLYAPSLFGFIGSTGTLDNNGNGQVLWNIPNLHFFQNITLHLGFVTIDQNLGGWQAFTSVSAPSNVTIQ